MSSRKKQDDQVGSIDGIPKGYEFLARNKPSTMEDAFNTYRICRENKIYPPPNIMEFMFKYLDQVAARKFKSWIKKAPDSLNEAYREIHRRTHNKWGKEIKIVVTKDENGLATEEIGELEIKEHDGKAIKEVKGRRVEVVELWIPEDVDGGVAEGAEEFVFEVETGRLVGFLDEKYVKEVQEQVINEVAKQFKNKDFKRQYFAWLARQKEKGYLPN